MSDIFDYIRSIAESARNHFHYLAALSTKEKNDALLSIADAIFKEQDAILDANKKDIVEAKEKGLDRALVDRLLILEETIEQIVVGLKQVINLPDPVGEMNHFKYLPSGIRLGKMRSPLGVITIVYESRPNVTIDAFSLCFKSGNVSILRGGSEAFHSNRALFQTVRQGLKNAGIKEEVVFFIDNTDRDCVSALLKSEGLIDVIIPRGGKSLVKRISEEARIPVIKHLDGICHIFIDEFADVDMAVKITLNAKTSRYGTCNTLETLLVDEKIAKIVLPQIEKCLKDKGVEIRACQKTKNILPSSVLAQEIDWFTEYLAPILSIKIVQGLSEAIDHINFYGSHHTDSIITENYSHSLRFLKEVDSASVMVNASTRFADGFEYGLGAEIGISTDKLHVRGPVGLEGLTNEKWIVLGTGQIRE